MARTPRLGQTGGMHRPWLFLIAAAAWGCLEVPALPPFDPGPDGPPPDAAADVARPDVAPIELADAGPAPVEACNNEDDDGDGVIDEGLTRAVEGSMPDQNGRCGASVERCVDGQPVRGPDRFSVTEVCDGLDNDCDNAIDEDLPFTCHWCDGEMADPPCNGCPDRTIVPDGFVCVPPGAFDMGSPRDQPGRDPDEGPSHRVVFDRPYLIAAEELSPGRWSRLWDRDEGPPSPAWFGAQGGGGACAGNPSWACPMERVSWYDALWFAEQLSTRSGRAACHVLEGCVGEPFGGCAENEPACIGGYTCARVEPVPGCDGFRLPTEAEWARAARAGSRFRFWSGDGLADLAEVDVFRTTSDGRTRVTTHDARANGYGLVDVHGNVAEWTFDGYAPYPDPPVERVDPRVDAGALRVVRGGSWDAPAEACRSAAREAVDPAARSATRGVRLALSVEPAPYDVVEPDGRPPGGAGPTEP